MIGKLLIVAVLGLGILLAAGFALNSADAREISIGPIQVEKIPEWKVDKQFNVPAVIKNSQIHVDNNGHTLNSEWQRVAWKTSFSQMGLKLPPTSNPDTRNQTEYVRTYDGACWEYLEGVKDLDLRCRQMTALVANEWQGYFAKDIGALMYMHPTFTNWGKEPVINDVIHERAEACSNPDSIKQRMYPPHHPKFFGEATELRQLIDTYAQAQVDLYIYEIENHLSQQHKDLIANHILNGYHYDFETGERVLIHPHGINCDLNQ